METMKQFSRSTSNKMLAGDCGGIEKYYNTDPTVVRVAFALSTIIMGGMPLFAYGAMALIMPLEQDDEF